MRWRGRGSQDCPGGKSGQGDEDVWQAVKAWMDDAQLDSIT